MVRRYEVWLVKFDPTIGSEISKTRPGVIVSPDEMNQALATVIVAGMTRTIKQWPSRVLVNVSGVDAEIALDQIRSVDKSRLVRRVGALSADEAKRTAETLVEMFSE